MKIDNMVSRITAYLHSNISKDVINALKEVGIHDLHLFPARSLVIETKNRLFSFLPGRDLTQDPLDTLFFLVKPEMEDLLVRLIIEKGHLDVPGRGSILVEDVNVLESHELCGENEIQPVEASPLSVHLYSSTGICCIMKRGQGDSVARIALDTGTCVPAIHFGTGTGVRDKMGLLRITIPAEKEIVHVFTAPHESDSILEMMIDAGRLGQPGSGFIYTFPIKKCLVNMRITRDEQHHAASIEQIVTALDHIKGNTAWRHRRAMDEKRAVRKKKYIMNLVELVLLCDGGTGMELVKAAMSAGAGGATISGLKNIRPPDSPLCDISPARDACSMVVPEEMKEAVVYALKTAGAFTDRCHGQVIMRRTSKAFTYVG
ncbi:MAG: hypothetical protein C4522_03855 [Desulfobacteraceae bacterium]|nr:MAG: hypothetical protein C4522_03855 [Desulfobacteraceae bacterium]